MKLLKNLTLISFLLATCVPTETKPAHYHHADALFFLPFQLSSLIISGTVFYTALIYQDF